MNILIIEDETAAAKHLQALIRKQKYQVHILAVLETVRSAVEWLRMHPCPELIIADIQLADGNSFEIFNTISITAPIIFTTAYDEYMQQAFKLHNVDYLLKPIDEDELSAAFDKYSKLQSHYHRDINEKLWQILNNATVPAVTYKSRFLVKMGDRLSTVPIEDVTILLADDRIVTLYDKGGRKFILDDSLDELERILNPVSFFRLNRRYIVPITSIERIQNHFNGKLHVWLKNWDDREVFVSREKAKHFKKWLDGASDESF